MNRPFRPASHPGELPAYYYGLKDEEITAAFRDFDEERNFEIFDRQTRNPNSSNFCMDFGDDDAWCAFDLSSASYGRLLQSPRPTKLHTRWINLWMPYNQKETLHALAKHYDFSPRLLGLMCSDPVPPKSRSLQSKKSSATLRSRRSNKSRNSHKSEKSSKDTSIDSEESIGMTDMMHSTQLEMVQDLSHYHIVNDVWHWSSVDWGRRFVCLGYNSLHNIRTNTPLDADHDEMDSSRDTPDGRRIWNWLLLCEDKTVISISEDPFPFNEGNMQAHDLRTLYTIRRNLVSVFRQLTKAPTPLRESSLIMLPIRHRVGNSEEETAHRSTDSPGLLFYYLFEDWFTTYSLVTRREHGYAAELDRLVSVTIYVEYHVTDKSLAKRNAGEGKPHTRRSTPSHRMPTRRLKTSLPKLRAHHRTGAEEARSYTCITEKLAHCFRCRLAGFVVSTRRRLAPNPRSR